MRELETFVKLGRALELASGGKSIILDVDGGRFAVSDHRFLLEPLADGAAVIARGLLNFLGLHRPPNGRLVEREPTRPDDLKMSHIGLTSLSVLAATSGWSFSQQQAHDLLSSCMLCADKVSAHITAQTAVSNNLDITSLAAAFRLVNELINREVYAKLNMPPVLFVAQMGFGSIEVMTP